MKKKWIEEARRLLTLPQGDASVSIPEGFSEPWLYTVKALGHAYFDWEAALGYFDQALENQRPDGSVPLSLSGFKQPDGLELQERPYFAPVLWRLSETAPDSGHRKSILAKFLPRVIAHQMSWYEQRDYKQEGLVAIIHHQESPQPTAITWDKWRPDNMHPALSGKLLVQDPYLNALLSLSNNLLLRMGNSIGMDLQDLLELQELTVFSMNEKLWNEEYSIFSAYDLEADEPILSGAVGCWMPWIGAVPDQNRAEAMRAAFETNFHHPDFYLCASNSIFASATFSGLPHRGAVHLWDNWLLYQGLQLYDFTDLARNIKHDLVSLCQQYGFQLHYPAERTPATTTPYQPHATTPAAGILIALLKGKPMVSSLI